MICKRDYFVFQDELINSHTFPQTQVLLDVAFVAQLLTRISHSCPLLGENTFSVFNSEHTQGHQRGIGGPQKYSHNFIYTLHLSKPLLICIPVYNVFGKRVNPKLNCEMSWLLLYKMG